MTQPVDVVVDPDDDIATLRAIRRLAVQQPSVLAVGIAPDSRTAPAVAWAILRSLGKRIEHLEGETPQWHMAETWLKAHQLAELVVLRAQHLNPARRHELARLGERTGVAITLVYSGHGAAGQGATLSLEELLTRKRRPPATEARSPPWPSVPRSHPLRVRRDCARALSRDEFGRVDALLFATSDRFDQWLREHPRRSRRQLCRAVAVLRIADDPNQRYLRDCAVTVTLDSAGGPGAPADQVDAIHATTHQ